MDLAVHLDVPVSNLQVLFHLRMGEDKLLLDGTSYVETFAAAFEVTRDARTLLDIADRALFVELLVIELARE